MTSLRTRRGFTLIELLAVVAMVALVAGIVLPRMGIGRERRTFDEAKQLAASLELARQRAAVTGVPHRLQVDLDRQGYRVEWRAAEEEAPEDPGPQGPRAWHPGDRDWARADQLPMAAPRLARRAWRPLPETFGATTWLPEGVAVTAVETPGRRAESGRFFVVFGPDGSGEATALELGDEEGNRVLLEVAPVADRVRIAWGGLDGRRSDHGG